MSTNETMRAYFIMKGISDVPELQAPIFVLVFIIYLFVLVGNMSLLFLVCQDSHLHTLMYFFLANLSVVDMMSSTVNLHKIFLTFITGDKTVSYLSCVAQFYMFASLTGLELFILIAMSYDRYVAICRPLNYKIIMNFKMCLLLASFCWTFGFLQYIPFIRLVSKISCFSSNVIDHFCCDLVPIMEIACSDLVMLETATNTQGLMVFIIIPLLLISTSYIFIIRSIMKIRSSIGRKKAFYTCSSHLTVIMLLYSTFIFQYHIPSHILGSKKLFSLFNMAVLPMLNPFIYSLKNKDVKAALIRQIEKCKANAFCCVMVGSVTEIKKKYIT